MFPAIVTDSSRPHNPHPVTLRAPPSLTTHPNALMRLPPRPPQLHTVLALLLVMTFLPTCSAILGGELAALLDLANTTSVGWNTTNTTGACDWGGVTCRNDTVVKLDLYKRGLTGHLPESLGNLIHLEFFDVGHNVLSGHIPESIGNLIHLERFKVHDNDLSGQIPESIGNLTHLKIFSASGNALSGQIPESIGNLPHLEYFTASGNALSGQIPESIGNLTHLKDFGVQYNFLSGQLPATMGNLQSLTELYINHNQFTGPISMLSSLTSLQEIQLSYNQFTDSLDFFISLSSLTRMSLQTNDFYGLISPAVTGFCAKETTECDFSDNNRLCGDGERGENTRPYLLHYNKQLPLLTPCHSPPPSSPHSRWIHLLSMCRKGQLRRQRRVPQRLRPLRLFLLDMPKQSL